MHTDSAERLITPVYNEGRGTVKSDTIIMWTPLFVCLFVAVAAQAENSPWKPNTQYQYAMRGRTLTALHQVANQYAGIAIKANVNVQTKNDNTITVQVSSAQYSDLHANLSKGWSSPIPDNQLHYQQIPLSNKPFELQYKNGVINRMVASKNIPVWELNFLKSIASQLQVDTQAKNLQNSRINSLPNPESVNGVFKTMEDSVSGECETLYDISPLPRVVLINKPHLAPLADLASNGQQLIDIVKTRNFSNCDVQSDYHFGITGITNWNPASNQMGEFLARSSVSRVVISGNLLKYTIQSSVTTNKIIASPFLFDKQNGMVVSRMNLTLVDVKSSSGSPQSPPNPQTIENLVYEYNPASPDENNQRPAGFNLSPRSNNDNSGSSSSSSSSDSSSSGSDSSSSSSSSSDSSSSSSEDSNRNNNGKIRKIRSADFGSQGAYKDPQGESKGPQGTSKGPQGPFKGGSSDSSSSSSSSSDSDESACDNNSSWDPDSDEKQIWQPAPKLTQAPNMPFLPFFIGNQGNSIQSAKEFQAVPAVKRIAQEIAYELMTPSAIPGQQTLQKFTILTRILRTMNSKQMEEASKELYFRLSRDSSKDSSQSSAESQKYHAWVAFRDAVAQAGTGPALLTIREWIQSKKVQGNEAAELVSDLHNTARYPNQEYMKAFFELANLSEVRNQQFLNTSAILSFTELARKAFISNSTAYNRFPVHVFGPLKPKRQQPVVSEYIPALAKYLKDAASQEDSIKIHTYIKALGNLGHPKILKVFEPYLEGKEAMTHFQRLTIVAALNKLAKTYPKVARPVLFRIYQNTGEATEVRVAAVFQIMKTNPPAQLLQRMAQFTNDDLDTQVISAVQYSIKTAANNLDNPEQDLRMNAQAAVNLLNPKEQSAHLSRNYLLSYASRQLNLAYKQTFSYIGSDDSFFPSNFFFTLRQNLGGFKKQDMSVSVMASSLEDIKEMILDQFEEREYDSSSSHGQGPQSGKDQGQWQGQGQSQGRHQYEESEKVDKSVPKIYSAIHKKLGMLEREQEQLELNMLLPSLGGKRFFAIDNHTIEQIPKWIREAASSARSGRSFNYTKIVDKLAVTVAFPTAMGLPFIYTLQTPTMLYVGGEVRVKTHPDIASRSSNNQQVQIPNTANATINVQFVYSSRPQSTMGFVVPFNRQHYVSGVNKNIQFNAGVQADIDIDNDNDKVQAKVQPLDQHNKQNLFEYSTVPHTSIHNIVHMAQIRHDQTQVEANKKIVHVRQPNQIHKTVGLQSTGWAFDVDYHSEQKFLDFAAIYNEARKHNSFSAAMYAWAEDSINLNNVTLAYNPQKSTAKYARFTAAYASDSDFGSDSDNHQSQNHGGQQSNKNYRNQQSRSGGQQSSSGSSSSDPSKASPNDRISASIAQPSSSSPGSQNRLQEILDNVGQNIESSDSQAWDLTAEFQGQNRAHYILTVAVASSNVSDRSRVLVFAEKNPAQPSNNNKPGQFCAAAESSMPNVPIMNYLRALNADPTSYVNAELSFGDKCNSQSASKIQFKGKMEQSSERRQYLEQFPLSQRCKQQMSQGNSVQYACRNMTTQANLLDKYRLSVQFEKIPESVKNATYKAYALLRHAMYQYHNEDLISNKNSHNKIELEAKFAPDLKSANMSVEAPLLSAQFNNVRVNRFIAPLVVMHPEYSPAELYAEELFKEENSPTCVIDKNLAETFDNTTYPIKLGSCWHSVFHYAPKTNFDSSEESDEDDEDLQLAILVRDGGQSDQKEVMIIVGNDNIHMKPTSGNSPANVKVNSDEYSISKNEASEIYDAAQENLLAVIYAYPDGTTVADLVASEVQVQYDGTAVKIIANGYYRSLVRGLCGTFNTQPIDDFTTPQECVLEDPFEFAATYALDDSACQGPAKDYKHKALQSISQGKCFYNTVLYGNVVTDHESSGSGKWPSNPGKWSPNPGKGSSNPGKGSLNPGKWPLNPGKGSSNPNQWQLNKGQLTMSPDQYGSAPRKYTLVRRRDGKMCFSIHPQPQCTGSYDENQTESRKVEFNCLEESSVTRHMEQMANKGAQLDVRSKNGQTVNISIELPTSCSSS